jgi:hypothetical protein
VASLVLRGKDVPNRVKKVSPRMYMPENLQERKARLKRIGYEFRVKSGGFTVSYYGVEVGSRQLSERLSVHAKVGIAWTQAITWAEDHRRKKLRERANEQNPDRPGPGRAAGSGSTEGRLRTEKER